MRIISGEFKGFKLFGPEPGDHSIRPSSDRLRQALFNVLQARGLDFDQSKGIDLFAGTGAFGLEAVSRGAERVLWVDHAPNAIEMIQKNIRKMKLDQRPGLQVVQQDVEEFLQNNRLNAFQALDWVFLDPPYDLESTPEIMKLLAKHLEPNSALVSGGWVILETQAKDVRFDSQNLNGKLEHMFSKTYGNGRVQGWQKN